MMGRQVILFLLLLGSNPCLAASKFPETIYGGLQLAIENDSFLVYLLPGVELGAYSHILLEETYVSFVKRWLPRTGSDDEKLAPAESLDPIRNELQTVFDEKFSQSLREGGFQLSNEKSEQVLLLKPSIIDLDIRKLDPKLDPKPELNAKGDVYAFTEDKSELTLYLEVFDAVSGHRLAIVYDRKAGRKTGFFLWEDRLMNRAAAERIITAWAGSLALGLKQARLSP